MVVKSEPPPAMVPWEIICKNPCIHLYDLLDVLDLVHELHLCHPPDVLELPDRPDHRQQKQKQQEQKQQHSLQQQRGARAKRAPPFIVSVPAVVSVVLFDQNLDQKIDLGWPGSSPGLAQVKP